MEKKAERQTDEHFELQRERTCTISLVSKVLKTSLAQIFVKFDLFCLNFPTNNFDLRRSDFVYYNWGKT